MAKSFLTVRNTSKGTLLSSYCRVADTYLSRLLGLIPKAHLTANEGLLLTKTGAITMLFMRTSIDAIAISKEGSVLAAWENLRPWVLARGAKGASCVLELPTGTLKSTQTTVGDQIAFTPGPSNTDG